jgi:hypothetical protein
VWQRDTTLVSIRTPGEPPTQIAADARFASMVALPGNQGVVLAYEQGPANEKQPGLAVERL